MITLTKGNSAEKIILTLTEKSTLSNPTYRISFTNVTTKDVVTFQLGVDSSGYPVRFNEFTIDTNTNFSTQQRGQWQYVCYENISSIEVENGKMLLNEATEFNYTGYNEATSYKGYGG